MMGKKCIVYIIVAMLLWFPLCVQASENAGVIISNLSYDEEYTDTFESTIRIRFFDDELYNDDVYLSYHVYDASGDNLVQYENQRVKINLDEKGEMICTVTLDLKDILRNTEKVVVRYDIVDQGNLYWFADNSDICFSTISISCEVDQSSANLRTLISGVTVHPIIFTINVLVSLIMIAAIVCVRRKMHEKMK